MDGQGSKVSDRRCRGLGLAFFYWITDYGRVSLMLKVSWLMKLLHEHHANLSPLSPVRHRPIVQSAPRLHAIPWPRFVRLFSVHLLCLGYRLQALCSITLHCGDRLITRILTFLGLAQMTAQRIPAAKYCKSFSGNFELSCVINKRTLI